MLTQLETLDPEVDEYGHLISLFYLSIIPHFVRNISKGNFRTFTVLTYFSFAHSNMLWVLIRTVSFILMSIHNMFLWTNKTNNNYLDTSQLFIAGRIASGNN